MFKQKLKSGADFMRDAQTGFNAVIRERYMNLPCICCEPYRHRLHAE
ncbi:recombination protein NinG [Pseudomonas amygdali]